MPDVAVARWRDLDTWTPAYTAGTAGIWPDVAVGDVLRPSDVRPYPPGPGETVQLAGVRWYGGGLFVRETRIGSELAGRCFPLVPGNLVYNRLFAWKSAFALVTEDFADVAVSTEFPQFGIERSRVLPEFICLICASGPFAQQISAHSSGTTAVSRNRLREADFLRLTLPLPPLPEQQRLIAGHAALQAEADTLAASADSREARAWQRFGEALGLAPGVPAALPGKVTVAWFVGLSRWSAGPPGPAAATAGLWPVAALGAHADICLGTQLTRRGTTQGAPHPYLRAANIRRGYVDLSDIKSMYVVDPVARTLELADGDLLFVEGNSREEVGRCAMWKGDPEDYIYQNSVIRARVSSEELDAGFACAWFNSCPGRRYFEDHATTTTGTLWHIGAGKTSKAPLPVPPKAIQREIAEELWREVAQARLERERSAEFRLRADAAFNMAVFGKDLPRR